MWWTSFDGGGEMVDSQLVDIICRWWEMGDSQVVDIGCQWCGDGR